MRAAFTLALLLLAIVYTILAFGDLNFLSATGRIGPGFFPRIIGVLLIAGCLLNLVTDLKERRAGDALTRGWRVVGVVCALCAVLIVALQTLGALPGMIVFMLLSLFILNERRPVHNVLLGTLLPLTIFVLFRYGLNATMPEGMLGIGF